MSIYNLFSWRNMKKYLPGDAPLTCIYNNDFCSIHVFGHSVELPWWGNSNYVTTKITKMILNYDHNHIAFFIFGTYKKKILNYDNKHHFFWICFFFFFVLFCFFLLVMVEKIKPSGNLPSKSRRALKMKPVGDNWDSFSSDDWYTTSPPSQNLVTCMLICNTRVKTHIVRVKTHINDIIKELRGLGTLDRFSAIFLKETTFLTSCLPSCTSSLFWKGFSLKGKNLLP